MTIVFDNVVGSVIDDPPPTTTAESPPTPPDPPISLELQLRKLDQRRRRLKAD
jgi:hypothetical protein